MEEQGHRLIIEYYEKTISDEGLTQLQEWIEQGPENLAQFSETIQILEAAKLGIQHTDRSKQSWEKVQQHIADSAVPVRSIRNINLNWIAAVAVMLMVSLVGLFWIKQRPEYVEVANVNGQRSKVTLPDGSIVHLAGGSRIKFIKGFTDTDREITLSGEAFFDVVHMDAKPFKVKSGSITTVVLGTSFNVKAYEADHAVAVTVRTGKVGVLATIDGVTRLVKHLTPGKQIHIDTHTGLYNTRSVKADRVAGWMNNDLDFYDTPLRTIAATVQRQYGVQIQFTDPELGDIKLTAKFSNSSLPDVLETLSALSGLAYDRTGTHIYFSNNDQKGGSIMR